MIAMPIGCGLRRGERGELGYRRPPGQGWAHPYCSNPIMGGSWVKVAIDEWKEASRITEGTLFRSID